MNIEQITSMVAKLTGQLQASTKTEEKNLHQLQDALATALVHQDPLGITKQDFIFQGELLQLILGLVKQRSDQFDPGICRRRIPPFHTAQPFPTASAQQTQKKQFQLVILVMSQCHGRNFQSRRSLREKRVSQFARGHFDGKLLFASEGLHIRTF